MKEELAFSSKSIKPSTQDYLLGSKEFLEMLKTSKVGAGKTFVFCELAKRYFLTDIKKVLILVLIVFYVCTEVGSNEVHSFFNAFIQYSVCFLFIFDGRALVHCL